MTFGQTLKQMLMISDLRASFLADQLGYDSSYISRWLSGQKLPSLKYNDELFHRIATVLVQNMNPDCQAAMIREMLPHLPEDMGAQRLVNELSKLLSNAYYANDSLSQERIMFRNDNRNASLAVLSQKAGYQLFYDAMEYLAKTSLDPYINMIVNAPPHFHANEEFSVIRNAPTGEGTKALKIHQTMNLHDFREHIDLYCARIFQFYSCAPGAYYYLYQADDRPSTDDLFILIENGLLFYYIRNPYVGQYYSLYSFDKDLIYEHYSATEANLNLRPRLTYFFDVHTLYERRLLYRYLLAGRNCMLLNVMYPIIMEADMYSRLVQDSSAGGMLLEQLADQYRKLWMAPKRVILFKTALVRYLCEGVMNLGGQMINVDEQTRKQHLKHMVRTLKENSECRLMILNDDTPLLNYSDCGVSLFLSDGIAFMENCTAEPDFRFIRLREAEMIEYFYAFFSHLENMDEKSILSHEQSLAFIERGLEML